jgi:hypothetical protein
LIFSDLQKMHSYCTTINLNLCPKYFMQKLTQTVQNEFWFHVANQDEIPIFGVVDKDLDVQLLMQILQGLPTQNQELYISQIILKNPDTIDFLRTVVGISDKRMYLELSYLFAKTKYLPTDSTNILGKSLYELGKHSLDYFKGLLKKEDLEDAQPDLYKRGTKIGQPTSKEIKRQEKVKLKNKAREIISNYLFVKGLLTVLNELKGLEESEWKVIFKNIISPKENQQKESKLRGHSAEQKLAELLHKLGINFLPIDKHTNPMASNDPNVNKNTFQSQERDDKTTYSFDLIIKNNDDELLVFLQSLIHTSDPGEYGVKKSNETIEIKNKLDAHNVSSSSSKTLWGLVDGVGFIENPKKTIDKMLSEFDCFVQLKSLYKAGLQLHKLGLVQLKAIRFDMSFYTQDEAQAMFDKYGSTDIQCFINNTIPQGTEIEAGKAWLYV